MQSSESNSPLPRRISHVLSQTAVNHFNHIRRQTHPRANTITGIVGDRSGMFELEVKKKRQVKAPA